MRKLALLGAFATLLPIMAFAQAADTIPVREAQPVRPAAAPVESYVQVYYVVSNKLHGDGDTISGNGGFGVSGLAGIGSDTIHPFVIGDYQETRFNDYDQTVRNTRFGLGVQMVKWFGVYAEYASIKFDNTLDGFGVHARFNPVAGPVDMVFQIGYLDLKNNKGPDVHGTDLGVAASLHFTRQLSAVLDYRATALNPKGGGDTLTISDLRVGGRFDFGK